jgi:hypothetical protein
LNQQGYPHQGGNDVHSHAVRLNTVKSMNMELTLNNGVTMPALGLGRLPKRPGADHCRRRDRVGNRLQAHRHRRSLRQRARGRAGHPNPTRIAENFDVFNFQLSTDELTAIDSLNTGNRNGPDPDEAREERFAMVIPEA